MTRVSTLKIAKPAPVTLVSAVARKVSMLPAWLLTRSRSLSFTTSEPKFCCRSVSTALAQRCPLGARRLPGNLRLWPREPGPALDGRLRLARRRVGRGKFGALGHRQRTVIQTYAAPDASVVTATVQIRAPTAAGAARPKPE